MNRLIEAIKYLIESRGRHGIHSPFIYSLLDEGIRKSIDFPDIEKLRKGLRRNHSKIENHFGTNAGVFKGRGTIAELTKNVCIHKKYGALLYKIALHFQPKCIIEMGTSLGISAAYLAKTKIPLITCEGNPALAKISQENLQKLGLSNAQVLNKSFADFIAEDLSALPSIPFLYLDGDHSYEATLGYFQDLLPKASETSVWIFDDIYWNAGMQKAWKAIQQHPKVTMSLDFFKFGIIFFHSTKQKEHYKIWY